MGLNKYKSEQERGAERRIERLAEGGTKERER